MAERSKIIKSDGGHSVPEIVISATAPEPIAIPTSSTENCTSSGTDLTRLWEDETNANNPRNWPAWRKWSTIAIVSFTEFLTHLTSLMYAPGLKQMQQDFGIKNGTLATVTMTVYVLGFGVGPLLFSPLSEVHGRMVAYRSSIIMFVLLNIACALSNSVNMLIVFRFIAGCFGASPVAIGGAIVSDLFTVEHRGTAMAIYHMGPVLGNLLGPPLGGVIIQYKGWRWVFWVMSILAGFACFCSFVILRETHHPTIQQRQYNLSVLAERENISTGDDTQLHAKSSTGATLSRALRRPVRVILFSPAVDLTCLIIMLQIGTQNLVFATLGAVFQDTYQFSPRAAGLVYLGVTIGFLVAAIIFGQSSDRVSIKLAKRSGGVISPEFRLVLTLTGLPLCAGGLFWYGWSMATHRFWLVPILGLSMLGMGLTMVQLSLNTYLIDAYTDIAASVLATSTLAKSVGGSVIPLAGPTLYSHHGLGWGNSILAFINVAFFGIALILFLHGRTIRTKYPVEGL